MTEEYARKAILTSFMLSCPFEEEVAEVCNYINEALELANIGKILTDCFHIEFGLKGTKKEPLVNIYINGGSNSKKLILRDVPRTEDMDRMISFINDLNFMNSIKERNKNDTTGSD